MHEQSEGEPSEGVDSSHHRDAQYLGKSIPEDVLAASLSQPKKTVTGPSGVTIWLHLGTQIVFNSLGLKK